jgi:hypothetical protein
MHLNHPRAPHANSRARAAFDKHSLLLRARGAQAGCFSGSPQGVQMGDKSPKSKQRDKNQKTAVKAQGVADAKAKQAKSDRTPVGKK